MLKRILESTLVMGASSILVMAMDLVRVKIMALLLGPEGVGTLSILSHFHSLAMTITGLGLGTGIARYVALYRSEGRDSEATAAWKTSLQVVALVSLAVLLVSCVASGYFSTLMTGTSRYNLLVIFYAASLPIAAYTVTSTALLQGLKAVGSQARINVSRSLLTIVILVPLVWRLGLTGAAISVVVGTVIHALLISRVLRRQSPAYRLWHWQPLKKAQSGPLFQYGATSLLIGTTYYLSHLLLKIIISNKLGLRDTGIYQPVWALTMTYLGLVLTSMSAYSYPRLCELREHRAINEELNGIVRISMLLIVPIMFALLILRRPLIIMLYDTSFAAAADFMPVQVIGDYFKVFSWALGMYLLPAKRLGGFIGVNLVQEVLMVALAWLWTDRYGLYGIALAFAVSYLVASVILVVYSMITIRFRFWKRNLAMLCASFAALCGIILALRHQSWPVKGGICLLIMGSWLVLSVRRVELEQALQYARTLGGRWKGASP